MKKTYVTSLPDRAGAFLRASEVISSLGLNITRVSYNKSIDAHMLFIEAEGEEAVLHEATRQLLAHGYLLTDKPAGSVILMEFLLRDAPGSVLPVLRLIHQFSFNISYIRYQAEKGGPQRFRMGLLVENSQAISAFIRQASDLCEISILQYDETEKNLDNTVFYISFANRIAERVGLSKRDKAKLLVQSNRVMELLDQAHNPPYKTFETIGRFAELLREYKGAAYHPRISRYSLKEGVSLTLLEPPCGSNTCVLEKDGQLLAIDSGFSCYREENLQCLKELFPGFMERKRALFLTHADVDHCGLADDFPAVYLSASSRENFVREAAGRRNLREENPLHAPYIRISKILSRYTPPSLDSMRPIDGPHIPATEHLDAIGAFSFAGMHFDVYEGRGGHCLGETVLVEKQLRLVFTGDIYVNIKGFSPEQLDFNRLAPYLMTSVDTDPAMAKAEREEIFSLLSPGSWLLIGGHGAAKPLEIE